MFTLRSHFLLIGHLFIPLFNPFATDNTLLCCLRFGHAKHITMRLVPENISSGFSGNASELPENPEEIFPRQYIMHHEQLVVCNLSSKSLISKGLTERVQD